MQKINKNKYIQSVYTFKTDEGALIEPSDSRQYQEGVTIAAGAVRSASYDFDR